MTFAHGQSWLFLKHLKRGSLIPLTAPSTFSPPCSCIPGPCINLTALRCKENAQFGLGIGPYRTEVAAIRAHVHGSLRH